MIAVRWLVLGALLALLLLFPAFGAAVLGVATAVVSQPLVVTFGLGLLVGSHMRRRWTA